MKPFFKIDMGEVTRLTRAGKLGEAMALLRDQLTGGGAKKSSQPARPAPSPGTPDASPAIDLLPRRSPGGAGSARSPDKPRPDTQATQTGKDAPLFDFPEALRTFPVRPPMSGFVPDLGEGLGLRRTSPTTLPNGARFEERMFANDAGARSYKVYVPSGYKGQALPVVVMLHGCTQDPDDFAAGTKMNEVAEEQLFLVAYPHQPRSANAQKCWNWFKTGDQRREGGEPSLIAGIARQVVEEFNADPARVYVAGLSAGGAAAAIMAATHPDVFAAVGVHSGLACGAAADMPSAFAAMGAGGIVRPRGEGPLIPTIVFHGDADRTVNPINGDHVVAQIKGREELIPSVTRSESPDGVSYTRVVHRDASGREALEQWVLHGAGHAWSGGSANGSFADPRGPDASREMIRFFRQHANAGARPA